MVFNRHINSKEIPQRLPLEKVTSYKLVFKAIEVF